MKAKRKKLVLPAVFVMLAFMLLAACGGPSADAPADAPPPAPEVIVQTVEVEVIKEVEVEVEKIVEVEVEVTPLPPTPLPTDCVAGWDEALGDCPADWGVLYLEVSTAEKARLWTDTGLFNDAGYPIFMPSEPAITYDQGEIIIAYNGSNEEEYYLNADGTLALAGPSFPNAQEFVLVGPASDGNWVATYPGRWRADGGLYFYKVAGPDGAGMFVLADDIFFPLCENLIIKYDESCNQ